MLPTPGGAAYNRESTVLLSGKCFFSSNYSLSLKNGLPGVIPKYIPSTKN